MFGHLRPSERRAIAFLALPAAACYAAVFALSFLGSGPNWVSVPLLTVAFAGVAGIVAITLRGRERYRREFEFRRYD